jgi:DNA polymerase III sliding clamp (beta) subunit (PCNA family)
MKKISITELKTALNLAKAGLAKNEMVEQTTSFIFKDGKVMTFNDEISVNCPLDIGEIEGAVKADEILAFLNRFKMDKKIIVLQKDNELQLKVGKSRAGFVLQGEIILLLEEVEKAEDWQEINADFRKGLKFCAAAASRDMSRLALTAVHLKDKKMEASDGYRLIEYDLVYNNQKWEEVLIPASIISSVLAIKPTAISVTGNWVHFKNEDNVVLSSRVLEGKFPDTEHLLKVSGIEAKFPTEEQIKEVIERAKVFAKRELEINESLNIQFSKGSCKISSQSEYGWFRESVKVASKQEFSFDITPYLLQDILSETGEFIFNSEEFKIMFAGENWKYIAMTKQEDKKK